MSSPIAWSDVLNLPGAANDGLANVPVSGQTMILSVVNSAIFLDTSLFDGEDGPITKLARCAIAAHMAALGKLGSGGALGAESDGRLSRTYAFPPKGTYGLTMYGQLFASLVGSGGYGGYVL
jgi:hypothetical protein